MNTTKIAISMLLFTSAISFAQKYEAELSSLSSGAKIVNSQDANGNAYVDTQEGNITFNGVTVEKAGKYTLKIRYKAGEYKANDLIVNGGNAGSLDFNATNHWEDIITAVTLKTGENSIGIQKNWGWVSIDYIEISEYQTIPFK